jgi:hypothetical protein
MYFATDAQDRFIDSLEEYEQLFAGATSRHLAIGEGSTRYLRSSVALRQIMAYAGSPRFIASVRDPVEMAQSLHQQQRFNCNEDAGDFKTAWRLQKPRARGECVPEGCYDPGFLMYGDICSTGRQIKTLFELVPRNAVLLLKQEDLRRDPRAAYTRILEHLGLEDDGRTSFSSLNTAKAHRFGPVWSYLRWVKRSIRKAGGPHIKAKWVRRLSRLDQHLQPRVQLSARMRQELHEYFAPDIAILEKETGWDLSHWKVQ